MSIIDIIEAPVAMWIDGVFAMFGLWKKTAQKTTSPIARRTQNYNNTPQRSNTGLQVKKSTKKKKIDYWSIAIHFRNSEKARNSLNWLKTEKRSNKYSLVK